MLNFCWLGVLLENYQQRNSIDGTPRLLFCKKRRTFERISGYILEVRLWNYVISRN